MSELGLNALAIGQMQIYKKSVNITNISAGKYVTLRPVKSDKRDYLV